MPWPPNRLLALLAVLIWALAGPVRIFPDPSWGSEGGAVEPILVPAQAGSRYASLHRGANGRVYLCWLEPAGERAFRLQYAAYEGDRFSAARTISQGKNWFVNWADFPSLAVDAHGNLLAHWLERNGADTYSYGVRARCSNDGGASWSPAFWLHDDRTQNEHGFVSLVPRPGGGFSGLWLDSRAVAEGGNVALWSRDVAVDGTLGPEHRLDDKVCSCCQTAAVAVGPDVLAVYRDRWDSEVRDISLVRRRDGRWTAPQRIHVDDWMVPG